MAGLQNRCILTLVTTPPFPELEQKWANADGVARGTEEKQLEEESQEILVEDGSGELMAARTENKVYL